MYIRRLGVMGTMMLSMTLHAGEANPLLGCWRCDSGDSQMMLRFDINHYSIDGEPLEYRLVSGAIQVPEPDGYSRYPYTLINGRLTIEVADTPPLICARVACGAGAPVR